MNRLAIAASVSISLVLTVCASGGTINVPADHSTIQAAINAASPLDVVVVAPGTYNEQIDFMGKAITVRGSGGANVTTIDANSAGSAVIFDDNEDSDSILEGFTITGGTGTSNGVGGFEGGGIYCFIASPVIRSCIVTGNTALGPGGSGGGMSCFFAGPKVVNSLFHDNQAQVSGGAVFNESGSSPVFINCTLADNTAIQGAGVFSTSSTPRLISCISWFNNDDAIAGGGIVTYSNIQTGFGGEGNINLNPNFANAGADDYSLASNSPCIDAGDSTAIAGEVSMDLAGDQRGVNDPDTVDTGKPVFGLVVDMGAYEFPQVCEGGESCPGDLTNSAGTGPDGAVDVFDLLELLTRWGACPP